MNFNVVGHFYKPAIKSDKVYMFGLRKTGATWTIMAKWGRRGNNFSNQIKGNYADENTARVAMMEMMKNRLREGYMDIESDEYLNHMKGHGVSPLTPQSNEIFGKLEEGESFSPSKPQTPEHIPFNPKDWRDTDTIVDQLEEVVETEMVCIDNQGIEASFDVGVEYVVEKVGEKNSDSMLFVYNKVGVLEEVFSSRFATLKEWNKIKK